ncbi:MAG: hypothetical protein AAF519_04775 [Bacteroidota bacterium]
MMKSPTNDQTIKNLKQEIKDHPEKKHRIILKAIKTAERPEVSKMIRKYVKKNLF